MKYLYMEITADKYELPLRVCDSASELARECGKTRSNISSQLAKKRWTRYVRVPCMGDYHAYRFNESTKGMHKDRK